MGAYYWYVKIPQCRYLEHGLKDVAFNVQKHITLAQSCHNFPLVSDKPPRDTRICETSLFSENFHACEIKELLAQHAQVNSEFHFLFVSSSSLSYIKTSSIPENA